MSCHFLDFSGKTAALKVPGRSVIPLRISICIAPDHCPTDRGKDPIVSGVNVISHLMLAQV
ncbi:hypothetical protein [Methanoregula sp.]|uniref:hypothetical protein n=1 Tax=Methanoregula sp. TaxID=2052170 RepID=UPI003562BB9B